METGFSVFLCAFLAFFGIHWYKKQAEAWLVGKKSKLIASKSSLNRETNPYRCVEIEPCSGACEKVKSYQSIRILLDKAPALPVQGCDRKNCNCKFARYNDRRNDNRREKDSTARQLIANMQGQRAKPDRRRT